MNTHKFALRLAAGALALAACLLLRIPALAQPLPPASPPQRDSAPRAAVWDRARLTESSQTAQTLYEYAQNYAAVMDASIATLNNAIAAKTPGLNVAEARRLIGQYKERKAGIARRVEEFLQQLLAEAAAELPQTAGGVLLEKRLVTWAAPEADVTDALIAALDAVNVELPELPQPLVLTPPKPTAQPAPAKSAPGKNAPKAAPPKNGGKKK